MKSNCIYKSAAVFLIVMAVLLYAGCQKKAEEAPPEPYRVSVQVIEPEFTDFQDTLIFSGVTDAPLFTKVSFMASGTIEKLNYDVGDPVEKGALLGVIDQRQYIDNVDYARAQVGLAASNLAKVRAGSRDQEIKIARSGMLQAEANLNYAKQELERYKRVYEEDAIPKQQYDSVVNQHKLALEQYEGAKKQYELVKEGAAVEDIQIAQSNVSVANAGLQSAESQLQYTQLFSPVDGVITAKYQDIGSMTGPSTSVYEIRSLQALDFTIYVPALHMDKIHMHDTAEISFFSNPERVIEGVVREIQPNSDPAIRSFQVKLRMKEAPNLKNLTGEVGRALFHTGPKVRGTFVPVSCLLKTEDSDGFYLYFVDDKDIAHTASVKLITIKGERAKIEAKIPQKARIVIAGQEYLKEEQLCRIVDAVGSWKYVTPDRDPDPAAPDNRL